MKRELVLAAGVVAMAWIGGCGGRHDLEDPSDSGPTPVGDAGAEASVGSDGDAGISEAVGESLSCDMASTPCGGNVVGTWDVMDCPLALTGDVDLRAFGLGCASGKTVSGSLEVSGTWTADAAGNVFDNTTTKGIHELELPAACLEVPETSFCYEIEVPLTRAMGYDTVQCLDEPETGGCTCTGTFDQQGGLAAISTVPLQTGTYSAAGTTLTTSSQGIETTYGYCVLDDAMVLTLATPGPIGQVVGSIVLRAAPAQRR